MKAKFCALQERGVLRLSGRDVRAFLQALVTRDLDYLTTAQTVYSALLTPQGKYLFDFFLAQHDGDILLDGEAARLDALMKRLNMYKLRADVAITKEDGWEISAVYNGNIGMEPKAGAAWPFDAGVAFPAWEQEACGIAISWHQRITVLRVDDHRVVERFFHRDAAGQHRRILPLG